MHASLIPIHLKCTTRLYISRTSNTRRGRYSNCVRKRSFHSPSHTFNIGWVFWASTTALPGSVQHLSCRSLSSPSTVTRKLEEIRDGETGEHEVAIVTLGPPKPDDPPGYVGSRPQADGTWNRRIFLLKPECASDPSSPSAQLVRQATIFIDLFSNSHGYETSTWRIGLLMHMISSSLANPVKSF